MKIVLVDDNILFREDLKYFLENKLMHSVIAEAGNRDEFISIRNFSESDVVLMGFSLGIMNGLEDAKRILKVYPELKIIAIAMNCEATILCKLEDAGFKGYISKTEIFSSLERVLELVRSGETLFGPMNKYSNSGIL